MNESYWKGPLHYLPFIASWVLRALEHLGMGRGGGSKQVSLKRMSLWGRKKSGPLWWYHRNQEKVLQEGINQLCQSVRDEDTTWLSNKAGVYWDATDSSFSVGSWGQKPDWRRGNVSKRRSERGAKSNWMLENGKQLEGGESGGGLGVGSAVVPTRALVGSAGSLRWEQSWRQQELEKHLWWDGRLAFPGVCVGSEDLELGTGGSQALRWEDEVAQKLWESCPCLSHHFETTCLVPLPAITQSSGPDVDITQ